MWRQLRERLPVRRRTGPSGPLGPRIRRIVIRVAAAVLVLDLLAVVYFVGLNAFDPPATAFMLEQGSFINDPVDIEDISPNLLEATLAHEDARLPTRFTALDWEEFGARAVAHLQGVDDPAGSSIPEQLSKNLLLFPAQISARKAVDAVLAEQLLHATSKKRVLELYLNVAQFGPHLYGVCDASWYYFGVAPNQVTSDQAAQLMGVLPGPIHTHRAPGGGIDMNDRTEDGYYELKKIRGSRAAVASEIAANGGGFGLVRAMGLDDTRTSRAVGPTPCTTMPQDVRDLLADGEDG